MGAKVAVTGGQAQATASRVANQEAIERITCPIHLDRHSEE